MINFTTNTISYSYTSIRQATAVYDQNFRYIIHSLLRNEWSQPYIFKWVGVETTYSSGPGLGVLQVI